MQGGVSRCDSRAAALAPTAEFAPISPVGEQFLRRRFGEPASLAYKPRLDAHLRRHEPPMSRILITSALPYINGIKHLGTLAGSMLPADVYARFQRSRGRETLYICATDEHGTPTELAAAEAGQDPATFCAEQHRVQHDLGRRFGLSGAPLGPPSSPQNPRLTRRFAQTLWEAGFIGERVPRQVYSNAARRFLPARYVIGTCPHCGYEAA